jgi:hypothetical protein
MDINPNQIKVRCIKANGQVVMLSKTTARDTAFLKKYGIRIEDEAYLNPQSQVFEPIQEAPKRRSMIRQQEPEIVVSQSAETMMEQTPEVPEGELTEVTEQTVEEEPLPQEIPTEETPTTKTRRK